jgi:hypothetical protein
LATSSCVGALVAGTSFQEIYENLPRGNSWFEYASYLFTITSEVPTLNKAAMIENGLTAVSDILTGVKAGSNIKNLQTLTKDLQALNLGIKPEEVQDLQLGYQEMNGISKSILGTISSLAWKTIDKVNTNLLGNIGPNALSTGVTKTRHFLEKTKLEISHSVDDFQGFFEQMRDIGFSLKNILYIMTGCLVLFLIYIVINHLIKCKNKKHKEGFKKVIKMLHSKQGNDQLQLEFKSKSTKKSTKSKSTKKSTKSKSTKKSKKSKKLNKSKKSKKLNKSNKLKKSKFD